MTQKTIANLIAETRTEIGELLAEKAAGTATTLVNLRQYRDDPHGFFEAAWPTFILTPDQRAALDIIKTETRLCCVGANGTGKDALVARIILWFIFAKDGSVIVTTPTQRQAKQTIIQREITPAFNQSKLHLPGRVFATALKRYDDPVSGMVSFSGSSLSSMSGYHAQDQMILLSEAQGVPDFTWEAAAACSTDASNVIVAIGNPIHKDGKFESASIRWPSVRFSALDICDLNIPGAASREWIQEQKDEWGEESDWYRVHVLGMFPVDDSDRALVTRAMLQRAVALHRGPDARPRGRYTFSLDPAEMGADSSVLAVRRGNAIIALHTWKKMNATETRDRVVEILKEYQCGTPAAAMMLVPGDMRGVKDFNLVVDSVAYGAGVADVLQEHGFRVTRFKSSHKASDSIRGDSKFYDKRAEHYWSLRLMLEAGTLALPDHPELHEELLNTRWGLTDDERIRIETKRVIISRIGRSPDAADAVMMSLSAANVCSGMASMIDF